MDSTYLLSGAPPPTLKRNADIAGPDFYPTPSWATLALTEVEKFAGSIWEPACGDGSMSEALKSRGYEVISTDLYDRGYGQANIDFTASQRQAENIITNPPYHSAQKFAEQGVKLAKHKCALLLRLAFLEGSHRANTIFNEAPPSRIWVFSERITFYPKGAERKGNGTTAYAWFVWDSDGSDQTQLGWIPPGLKKRFG